MKGANNLVDTRNGLRSLFLTQEPERVRDVPGGITTRGGLARQRQQVGRPGGEAPGYTGRQPTQNLPRNGAACVFLFA